jgi:hypothetical protein
MYEIGMQGGAAAWGTSSASALHRWYNASAYDTASYCNPAVIAREQQLHCRLSYLFGHFLHDTNSKNGSLRRSPACTKEFLAYPATHMTFPIW